MGFGRSIFSVHQRQEVLVPRQAGVTRADGPCWPSKGPINWLNWDEGRALNLYDHLGSRSQTGSP